MPIFSSGYPEKTSNSDEDRFLIADSIDSNKIKGTKWSTIKSSIEGFTDWITASMLKNDSVIPNKLQSGTGSSWEWQDWVPTLDGFTGSPTIHHAKYIQIGKFIYFNVYVTGTSNATSKYFSIPKPASDWLDATRVGDSQNNDGGENYIGNLILRMGSPQRIQVYRGQNGSSGTPFTNWSNSGDVGFRALGMYEAA